MLIREAKLAGTPEQFAQLDAAIRTGIGTEMASLNTATQEVLLAFPIDEITPLLGIGDGVQVHAAVYIVRHKHNYSPGLFDGDGIGDGFGNNSQIGDGRSDDWAQIN